MEEARLVQKIRSKGAGGGLHHLTLEEVETAYKSRRFADEWQRITGSRLSEHMRVQMAERLQRASRSKDEPLPGLEGEASSSDFLKAAGAGDNNALSRWLESKDRRRLLQSKDEQQRNCVHLAARAGHVLLLRLLYDHGAEMEACDRFGKTPLHLACEYGMAKAAEVLLDCGCQPGAKDKSGRTPLHLAACCEESSIAKLLLSWKRPLVGYTDNHGRSPLFYAVLNVHPQAQTEVTNMLLEHLAEVEARDAYGRAALHYAAEEGRRPAVSVLLSHGANPQAADAERGTTPLDLACNEHVMRELRRAGGVAGPAPPPLPPSEPAQASTGPPPPTPSAGRGEAPKRAPLEQKKAPAPPPKAGPTASAQQSRIPQVPEALGTPFQMLQARFLKIMERVQEGGLQQMEHIKRPHLFTASWMSDVSTHQQLLGQTLKYVPGPEVCLRVFNLLRPPSHFPATRGDERDIISYYGEEKPEAAKPWAGEDPYVAAMPSAGDDLTTARRVELLRAIHEQRQELDSKDSLVEELRRKGEKLQAELAASLDADEAKVLRGKVAKAHTQLTSQSEELEEAQANNRTLQGQIRVLADQYREEQQKSAELTAEQCAVRRRLEAELSHKGEERSWRMIFEQEREKSEAIQRTLEWHLQEAQAEKVKADASVQGEVLRLNSELQRISATSATELEALRHHAATAEHRAASAEQQLLNEQSKVQRLAQEAEAGQASTREVVALRAQLQAAAMEAPALKAELEAMRSSLQAAQQELQALQGKLSAAKSEGAQVQSLKEKVAEVQREKDEIEKKWRELRREKDDVEKKWQEVFSKYRLVGELMLGRPEVAPTAPIAAGPPAAGPPAAGPPTAGRYKGAIAQPPTTAPAAGSRPSLQAGATQMTIEILRATGLRNADWLGKSDPYCTCLIQGQPESKLKTAVVKNNVNPVWDFVHQVTTWRSGDTLEFEVFDDEPPPKRHDRLGKAVLKLTKEQLLQGPHEEELQLAQAGKGVAASLFVRATLGGAPPAVAAPEKIDRPGKAAPEARPSKASGEPQVKKEPAAAPEQVTVEIVSATGLRNADWMGTSDPYCRCSIRGKPKTQCQTGAMKNSLNPVWDFQHTVLDWQSGDTLDFEVFDEEPAPKRHDRLGKAELKLTRDQLVGGAHEEELLLADAGKGSMARLKVRVSLGPPAPRKPTKPDKPEGVAAAAPAKASKPEAPSEVVPKKEEAPEETVTLEIVGATGLRNADWVGKSDPYCTCSIRGKPETKCQTSVVKDSLSPVWDFKHTVPCWQSGDTFELEVFDEDPAPKKHDRLGKAELKVTREELLRGTHEKELLLADAGKGIAAKLKVRLSLGQLPAAASAPAGKAPTATGPPAPQAAAATTAPPPVAPKAPPAEAAAPTGPAKSKPEPPDPADQVVAQPKPFEQVSVEIVSASGLRNADFTGKSDPYCTCVTRGKPESKFKTPPVKDTLDPAWNFVHTITDWSSGDAFDFEVYDEDPWPKKDDFLGKASLTLTREQLAKGTCEEELTLSEAGKGVTAAKLLVRVSPAGRVGPGKGDPTPAGGEPTAKASAKAAAPARAEIPAAESATPAPAATPPVARPDQLAATPGARPAASTPGAWSGEATPATQPATATPATRSGEPAAEATPATQPATATPMTQAGHLPEGPAQTPATLPATATPGTEVGGPLAEAVPTPATLPAADTPGTRVGLPVLEAAAPQGADGAGSEGEVAESVVDDGSDSPALEPSMRPFTQVFQPVTPKYGTGQLPAGGADPGASMSLPAHSAFGAVPPTTPPPTATAPAAEEEEEPAPVQPAPELEHRLKVTLVSAKGLRNADLMGKSDPYCTCQIEGIPESKFQTPVIDNNLNPEWNHEHILADCKVGTTLLFEVWDKDPYPIKDDFLGKVQLTLTEEDFRHGEVSGNLRLAEAGKGIQATLQVKIVVLPAGA